MKTFCFAGVALLLIGFSQALAQDANPFLKFQRQNLAAAEKVKQTTARNLEAVESMRSSAPDEAVRLLR